MWDPAAGRGVEARERAAWGPVAGPGRTSSSLLVAAPRPESPRRRMLMASSTPVQMRTGGGSRGSSQSRDCVG